MQSITNKYRRLETYVYHCAHVCTLWVAYKRNSVIGPGKIRQKPVARVVPTTDLLGGVLIFISPPVDGNRDEATANDLSTFPISVTRSPCPTLVQIANRYK